MYVVDYEGGSHTARGHVVKTAAELELYCFRESFDEAKLPPLITSPL